MDTKYLNQIYYGGDYNPDQWPEAIWEEDFRLFQKAGVNILTLPVFSWGKLEPAPNEYHWEWLDKIFDLAEAAHIAICLATSTAVQPQWMAQLYPEMLPVDFDGRRRKFGGRVKFCPNNSDYLRGAKKLVTQMAMRYKNRPNLILWHIGNEYDNVCYCDHCQKKFQQWVEQKYGSIEVVNEKWYMSFWGHTLSRFDQIVVPNGLSEVWYGPHERTTFQGITLDYKRFMNESILGCYLNELEVIRQITPNIPITTNLMGAFKPLDYFEWAKHMDLISWDNYPSPSDPPYRIAMRHDLMRGLKAGTPFWLMEQTPSTTNWLPYNATKRPGMLRLQSYQAMAHGADAIMYFQMRQSRGACEKYHGALIDHSGSAETRVFKECTAIGNELKKIGTQIIGGKTPAQVAIVFDWENWWALELSSGPSIDVKYVNAIEKYYQAFHQLNIGIDFVKPEWELSQYKMVIVPMLYMIRPGIAKQLERYVAQGGHLFVTCLSGLVDANDLVTLGGFPGELKSLLGIWSEEIDALAPEQTNEIHVLVAMGLTKTYTCGLLCEVIHCTTSSPIAKFGQDYYKDSPAITMNLFGQGKAYYIGTQPEDQLILDWMGSCCQQLDIKTPFQAPEGVEITERINDNHFIFVMNHGDKEVVIEGITDTYIHILEGCTLTEKLKLQAKEIAILRKVH